MSEDLRAAELRRFLKDRRARLSPADVGLPNIGRRRVRGLRREEVAMLANIGVSWYTVLETGDARGVSDATLHAVAGALRLSDSERHYLLAISGRPPGDAQPEAQRELAAEPSALVLETLGAIAFPAYLITPAWQVLACNAAFRTVWAIDMTELPFNAIERLFIAPAARALHGDHFARNVEPIVAMLHSAIGRRPELAELGRVRDLLLADDHLAQLWNRYEIRSPLVPNEATIESPIGLFAYETLNLPITGALHGLVVQVPDAASRARLAHAMAKPVSSLR